MPAVCSFIEKKAPPAAAFERIGEKKQNRFCRILVIIYVLFYTHNDLTTAGSILKRVPTLPLPTGTDMSNTSSIYISASYMAFFISVIVISMTLFEVIMLSFAYFMKHTLHVISNHHEVQVFKGPMKNECEIQKSVV